MSFALYLSRARRGDLRGDFFSFDFFSFASIFAKERSRKKRKDLNSTTVCGGIRSCRDRTGIDFVKEREKAQLSVKHSASQY